MLLIWDLDGTLVDSRNDIVTAANAALGAMGRPAQPAAQVVRFVGDGIGTFIERLLPGSTADERDRCLIAFEQQYADGCCRETVAYPGIRDALRDLTAAGWRHAVATNKTLAFTTPILAHCGLTSAFVTVRGGDGRRKPDPWQLQDIMRELQVDAGQTWMIGDHHTDIRAARAAGCRVLFCGWGLGHADGLAVDAMAMAPDEIAGRIVGFPRV